MSILWIFIYRGQWFKAIILWLLCVVSFINTIFVYIYYYYDFDSNNSDGSNNSSIASNLAANLGLNALVGAGSTTQTPNSNGSNDNNGY